MHYPVLHCPSSQEITIFCQIWCKYKGYLRVVRGCLRARPQLDSICLRVNSPVYPFHQRASRTYCASSGISPRNQLHITYSFSRCRRSTLRGSWWPRRTTEWKARSCSTICTIRGLHATYQCKHSIQPRKLLNAKVVFCFGFYHQS